MVMGPTHAMSGAALWLTAAAASVPLVSGAPLPVVSVYAAVCAGSALLPDLDCPGSFSMTDGSTVVRAFGVLGEVLGHTLNNLSLAVYSLTRSKYDPAKENGHRTLTHTLVFTVGLGLLVSLGAALPGHFSALGREWATGAVISLAAMWACLHLALFGLFDKWTKKTRKKYGLLGVMAVSGVLTAITAASLPHGATTFPLLGLAVGAGAAMHLVGDGITKMGVPALWPIPIRGKRWYDVSLPTVIRIRAGGPFEYIVLLPLLTVVTVGAFLYLTSARPLVASVLHLL